MASASNDLSSKYQKMTDLEHILKKPDTYIGSIQLTECTEYTTSSGTSGMSAAEVSIGLATFAHIPALYKLVDEGLVNMRDHVIRQAQAIKDGKIYADPIQFPDKMGAQIVDAIIRHSKGETLPPQLLIPTSLYRRADAERDPELN